MQALITAINGQRGQAAGIIEALVAARGNPSSTAVTPLANATYNAVTSTIVGGQGAPILQLLEQSQSNRAVLSIFATVSTTTPVPDAKDFMGHPPFRAYA